MRGEGVSEPMAAYALDNAGLAHGFLDGRVTNVMKEDESLYPLTIGLLGAAAVVA